MKTTPFAAVARGAAAAAVLLALAGCALRMHVGSQSACCRNLQAIDNAKARFAEERRLGEGAMPSARDLAPYIPGGWKSVRCAGGGTYSINAVGQFAACSIGRHNWEYRGGLHIEARLARAVQRFRTDCGAFPAENQGLQALVSDPAMPGWRGPYLTPEELLDPWGTPYRYELKRRAPRIVSAGVDKTFGSADDVVLRW
ncbi:MAG: type II secretion system protein GspG [Kiritimatiellae bacterium]|nr:type II secretion system protein GspG [Kiritimatiellia bacterium]